METNNKNTAKKSETTNVHVLTCEERNNLALEIAGSAHTCKQVSAEFSALADKYGKDTAKEILAQAKAQVKAHAKQVAGDAKSVREFLCDGESVARAAWKELLADESVQGRMWARMVYESAGCSLEEMVLKYADYVAEVDGIPALCARRATRKNPVTGERESGYAPLSATVAGWLSALKTAVKNAKKAALGAKRSDYQRTVTLSWGLDA